MDALIRSVHMAPMRTRLSEARANGESGVMNREGLQAAANAADVLRATLESQIRAELSAELQKRYQSERERGWTEGYAESLAEARKEAAAELAQAREQMKDEATRALKTLEQAHEAAMIRLEASAGEVAFAAVCRLLYQHATSQSFVLRLVRNTCAELRADTAATARLHPRDISTLSELAPGHELRVNSIGLQLIADESLQLGGCIVEAPSGRYDGGLESQLRRLHAVLTSNANASGE
jgi:flagellar assembly protein FliH